MAKYLTRLFASSREKSGGTDARLSLPRVYAALLTCLILGCSTFDLSKRIPWDSDANAKPMRMTTLWTYTTLRQTGQKVIRGFGGRVMFHAKDSDKPIKVEGTMIVFAFDVTKRVSTVPERKYVFTPEQFEKHYSQSKLGHSYSIWLPWDEAGGPPKRISLVARFEPTEGSGMIMSEDSVQTLPGIEPDQKDGPQDDPGYEAESDVIQQAGYQTTQSSKPAGPPKIKRERMTDSDPIDLTPSFIRRLGTGDELPVANEANPSQSATAWNVRKETLTATDSDPRPGINSRPSSDRPGDLQTPKDQTTISPQEALRDRQKELSDRFGRRKYQAQRAPSARSAPAVPQYQQLPKDEPSLIPPSTSLEAKGRLD